MESTDKIFYKGVIIGIVGTWIGHAIAILIITKII